MSIVLSMSSIVSCSCFVQYRLYNSKPPGKASLSLYLPFVPFFCTNNVLTNSNMKAHGVSKNTAIDCTRPNYQSFTEENSLPLGLGDHEKDIEDSGSPWEGAVIYKRNPSIYHMEYCTTLERLGLGNLSTETSKSRASVMGLRITKSVKDYPHGTPVQISIDITKKKQKLRLDGIIRTVITLMCNRCGENAAKCIFSNFSLLLSEEPIEEPDVIDMGFMCWEDKNKTFTGLYEGEENDEASIDLDDQLYFPPEKKEIDISKNIRDILHLEISIDEICDLNCQGLCFKCGTNLNNGKCNCNNQIQEAKKKSSGPLGNLRKQLQQK